MPTKTQIPTTDAAADGDASSNWFGRLRVRWQNLRCWKTRMAYRILTKAMKRDPDFAHTWQCNIACPLMDAGMNHRDANAAKGLLGKYGCWEIRRDADLLNDIAVTIHKEREGVVDDFLGEAPDFCRAIVLSFLRAEGKIL